MLLEFAYFNFSTGFEFWQTINVLRQEIRAFTNRQAPLLQPLNLFQSASHRRNTNAVQLLQQRGSEPPQELGITTPFTAQMVRGALLNLFS